MREVVAGGSNHFSPCCRGSYLHPERLKTFVSSQWPLSQHTTVISASNAELNESAVVLNSTHIDSPLVINLLYFVF